MFTLDPKIEAFSELAYDSRLVKDVWKKYFWPGAPTPETHINHVFARVAKAIANGELAFSGVGDIPEQVESTAEVFYELMSKRMFIPGGRILAGAGTDKRVTLMNCYVNRTIEDSMQGIGLALLDLRDTMQQGGGMGTAFETIRPKGARLKRTQSHASGVLPFMDEMNGSSRTIMSAGDRSGAMMGTISDTHPDMPEFVKAKAEGSKLPDGTPLPHHMRRWSQFNVSVLISDAFMSAVEEDADWLLYFNVDTFKARSPDLINLDFVDDDGVTQYVYSKWRARDLWNLITEYTYAYSDPGIIFIDRVNDRNNLGYVETIRCTNPCGEQPLPPNGTCNLGAINVSQFVDDPFSPDARVNWDLLEVVAGHAVRFLDNVIEVTAYPLEAQKEEEYAKRRIGLGLFGLGTMFAELCTPYGSLRSVQIAERVMKTIAIGAYKASIALAKERGSFPLFDAEKMLNQSEAFVNNLPFDIQQQILTIGLRNGVVLTIAPVGTGAIAAANPSSGLEPDFQHIFDRMVRKGSSDEWEQYTEESYTYRFFKFCTGETEIPKFMNTAMDLTIEEHIQVMSVLQKWIDASVSKTINVPEDMPYEQFVDVYRLAYESGCKGCTTYRPTKDRMSILNVKKDSNAAVTTESQTIVGDLPERGDVLEGSTYKIKWPSMAASMYVTINYKDKTPHEIFFASKDAKYAEWMTGLTLMISAVMRLGVDPSFIPTELRQVISTHDVGYHNGKFYGSLVARIAQVIEDDFVKHGIMRGTEKGISPSAVLSPIAPDQGQQTNPLSPKLRGTMCPECGQPAVQYTEGCKKCTNCTYSAC